MNEADATRMEVAHDRRRRLLEHLKTENAPLGPPEPLPPHEEDVIDITFPSGRRVHGRITALYGKRADVIVWHKRQPWEVACYPTKWLSPIIPPLLDEEEVMPS